MCVFLEHAFCSSLIGLPFLATESIFDSVNGETDKREGKDKSKLRKTSAREYMSRVHDTHTIARLWLMIFLL